MILLLRGHIRDSFDNNNLYNLVADISDIVDDLEIYIQTWSVVQSGISWREMEQDDAVVDEYLIQNYFRRLNIKNIIILDDSQIELIGNTSGFVSNTKMPIRGWKNMIYGMYQGIKNIKENHKTKDNVVLNMRFDVLRNSFGFTEKQILDFVEANCEMAPKTNVFMINKPFPGCDNAFIGTINTTYGLIERLYSKLDEVLKNYPDIFHQEYIVFYESYKQQKHDLVDAQCPKNLFPSPQVNFLMKYDISSKTNVDTLQQTDNAVLETPLPQLKMKMYNSKKNNPVMQITQSKTMSNIILKRP